MKYNPTNAPKKCGDMSDIRTEIDHIDHLIIKLLATRFEYVKEASKFKKNKADVQAQERFNLMLEQRKQWANELGLDGEVIKEFYSDLVKYFIAEELKHFNNQ